MDRLSVDGVEQMLSEVKGGGVYSYLTIVPYLQKLLDTLRENERVRSKLLEADSEASAEYLLNIIDKALSNKESK